MYQYHPSLVDGQGTARDRLLTGLTPSLQSDRNLSQHAADRYALQEALAERRRQHRSSGQPRRLWAWRHARQTEARTA
jgi:hypothetical protein